MTGRAAALVLAGTLVPAAPLCAQSGAAADSLPPATVRSPTDAHGGGVFGASPWLTRGAGFAMLVATDVGLRRAVQDLRSSPGPFDRSGSVGDGVAELGNGIGDWKSSLPYVAAGSVAVGALVDGLRGAGRGLSVLGGVAAGTMVNEAVNQAIGRSRPIWGEGVLSFDPFSGHASLPSGHVSLAFSVAGGVDAATDGWLPAAAAYTLAGSTAFARVYSDKHWVSDVVVGAVLSATVSRLATRRAMDLLGVEREGSPSEGAAQSGAAEPSGSAADGERSLRARLLFSPNVVGVQLRF